MFTGFQTIIEERIRAAQRKGVFENLPGTGEPLVYEDDRFIPEELRMAYKILKNADCTPPELELKKEIRRTEELLEGMEDEAEKYRALKKLNFLILKLNTTREGSIMFDTPQHYTGKLVERLESR
ncbi:MAG: DUF1992 domain-containing protein, partial [Desulfobacterales bacterium]|nr:DUF1992 domain-containing protein [Desulfobacterales bacterium]